MHDPLLFTWLLVALATASGGYRLSRLRPSAPGCGPPGGRPWQAREADAAEAAMGLGMAGMALLPGTAWGWLYGLLAAAGLLGALAAAAPGLRAARLHHTVGALAMAYMAFAMPAGHGMSGHPHHAAPPGLPLLTGALLLYFGGYALWTGRRLLAVPGAGTCQAPGGVVAACRAAMGIGMFAMLLTL